MIHDSKNECVDNPAGFLCCSGRRTIQYESPMEKLVKLFDTLMEGGPVPDKDTLMKYRCQASSFFLVPSWKMSELQSFFLCKALPLLSMQPTSLQVHDYVRKQPRVPR